MKIYYDRSTNGEILFWLGVLIAVILCCGLNQWIYALFTIGLIPIIMLITCTIRRKIYYIKRENNYIIFTFKNQIEGKTKKGLYKIEKSEVVDYFVKNKRLTILTKDQKFTINNFYVQNLKVEEIFK